MIVKFLPVGSSISAGFWHVFGQRKLDQWKLSEEPHELTGTLGVAATATAAADSLTMTERTAVPGVLELDESSFGSNGGGDGGVRNALGRKFEVGGTLVHTNTSTAFAKVPRRDLFAEEARRILGAIQSGDALARPELTVRFLIVAYADLKRYKFRFSVGVPALLPPSTAAVQLAGAPQLLADVLSDHHVKQLRQAFLEKPWFAGLLAAGQPEQVEPLRLDRNLSRWAEFVEGGDDFFLVVADSSPLEDHPGWALRNLLLLCAVHMAPRDRLRVICLRERFHAGNHSLDGSRVLTCTGLAQLAAAFPRGLDGASPEIKAVGWEKIAPGKTVRSIDLSANMDPKRLAASAVDLNLKLMRWRLLPSVDLERIRNQRCLLLGAGTLGCNVARQLLAWGVRHITLLDSGTVSFSNPVRQSLFEFEDCISEPTPPPSDSPPASDDAPQPPRVGAASKAEAAARRLTRIFPDVQARGLNMRIPMPGHPVAAAQRETVAQDIERLQALIQEHDVVYLLMDSRESRWLPTLLCAAANRLCITTALGFDTYVVMRHGHTHLLDGDAGGAAADPAALSPASPHLGCYFCNDVVAPRDSQADRTLDQQCTVTRPAVSMMASALAVELMVAVLHHPLGAGAPADEAQPLTEPTASDLGLLPHQVRGFLSHYQTLLVVGHQYDRCTACSRAVVEAFRAQGMPLLFQVFENPVVLEDISGHFPARWSARRTG